VKCAKLTVSQITERISTKFGICSICTEKLVCINSELGMLIKSYLTTELGMLVRATSYFLLVDVQVISLLHYYVTLSPFLVLAFVWPFISVVKH
jgi:hypothetical protein